tara:strand:+ start:4141 stop:5004 length:864 start_codon:yes stop_codon:yes gene_type:complete
MAGVTKAGAGKNKNIKNDEKLNLEENNKSNNQELNIEDIRRIEALEALVSEMEVVIVGLKESLKQIFKLGIDKNKIKSIVSSAIEGEVTEKRDGRIIGWAKNMVDQTSSQAVSVYYQDKFLTMAIANKKIDGQENNKLAYGNGFKIILPRQFYDGKTRNLSFRVGDYEVEIGSRIGSIGFEEDYPLEGKIKSSKNGIIKGWALDIGNIKNPVIVSAYYGKELIAKTLADNKDTTLVKKLGKTNCYHGFKLEIPPRFGDNKNRNFKVVISPWNYAIIDGIIECKFSRK